MNRSRISLIVLFLIYMPLLIMMFFNLVPPFTTFDIASFLRTASIMALILFFISLIFFTILRIMPEKFVPFYVGVFMFAYILFVRGFVFIAVYQAPNFEGLILNLSVIPSPALIWNLWIISCLTAILMLCMKINKKTAALIFCGAIVLSTGVVLAKELTHRFRLAKFFGYYKEGKIVFISPYDTKKQPYVFRLAERKFKKFPKEQFEQISDQLPGWSVETFSPDSNFKVYKYAYNRDDLPKIFVTNVKTGKTILLAAGEDPIWVVDTFPHQTSISRLQ